MNTGAQALAAIPFTRHSILVSREEHFVVVVLSRMQARQVLLGDSDLLYLLYTLPCQCRTKTASLINHDWSSAPSTAVDIWPMLAHAFNLLVATIPSLRFQEVSCLNQANTPTNHLALQ